MTSALVVADVLIPEDASGRYNLNFLHRASECPQDATKAPNRWARTKTAKALLAELQKQVPHLALEIFHGGDTPGTFAHELLAVSYAGWISPTFQLRVNQAFLDRKRREPVLPTFHNPQTKMLVETLFRLDALESEQAVQKDLIISTQLETIKAQDMALTALRGQAWMTIRQWVFVHSLESQLPPKAQKAYALHIGDYSRDNGIPMYKAATADVLWPDERTYHVQAIADTLPGWLARQGNQIALVPRTGDTP